MTSWIPRVPAAPPRHGRDTPRVHAGGHTPPRPGASIRARFHRFLAWFTTVGENGHRADGHLSDGSRSGPLCLDAFARLLEESHALPDALRRLGDGRPVHGSDGTRCRRGRGSRHQGERCHDDRGFGTPPPTQGVP